VIYSRVTILMEIVLLDLLLLVYFAMVIPLGSSITFFTIKL
jgi:hypothetical protein